MTNNPSLLSSSSPYSGLSQVMVDNGNPGKRSLAASVRRGFINYSDMHDSRQDVSPSYNLLSSPSLDPNHSDNRAHVMVTRSMNGSLKSRVFPSLDVSVSIAPVETTCFTQESKDSRWLTTISEEFNALVQNHTWTLVPPPPNVNIVDDMLIAAKKKYDIQKLKGLLSAKFEMKDLGAARKILGMEIIRDGERRKLFLSQRSYIQKVLARFGMSSSKPIDTPSAANIHLTAMFAPQSEEEKEYIGTSDVGLIYEGDTQFLVTGYSDSDYAGDVDTRRSMTGYVFTLGGSVVSWKATLQPTVTLSTTEAEYMALTEAAKEGIWLKGLPKGFQHSDYPQHG
uniref:Reverse transcriptase Ty1/copia-type domain-containing protein n=1 Tax=Solanum lycopersicum TaxID=4081 RepID=A0A3Q7EAS5_SOLLC